MRITMDRVRIKEILVEEKYPEFMIEKTADKIENFSQIVAKAFRVWYESKEHSSIVVEGFSFKDLISKWGMNPIGAFITLDWLMREPEKAKEALNRGVK